MKCHKVKRYFSAYFEDDLSVKKSEAVRSHLQGCDLCQREWESFMSVVQAVRSMPRIEPSEYFNERLRAKILQLETQESGGLKGEIWGRKFPSLNVLSFHFRPLSLAFAMILLLLAVGLQLYRHVPTPLNYLQNQTKAQNSSPTSDIASSDSSTRFILPDVFVSRESRGGWRDFDLKELGSEELTLNEASDLNLVLPSVSNVESESDYVLKRVSFSELDGLQRL